MCGDAASGLDGVLVSALRDDSPQARHSFTAADQVHQLVSANEAEPDLGFIARMMALCSLPRSNPGNTGGVAGDHAARLPSTGLLNGGGGPPTDQLAGEPDPPRYLVGGVNEYYRVTGYPYSFAELRSCTSRTIPVGLTHPKLIGVVQVVPYNDYQRAQRHDDQDE